MKALTGSLTQKKDCTAKFKSVGKAARVHDRERRVISTREGKQRVKVTREAHVAACDTLTTTDTRIADHPVVLEEPKDHAVTSITQWCWRPPTNHSGNESSRPDGVKPDLANSRPRCGKLRC